MVHSAPGDPGVGFPDGVAAVFLVFFWNLHPVLHSGPYPFTVPAAAWEGSLFSTFLSVISFCRLVHGGPSICSLVVTHCCCELNFSTNNWRLTCFQVPLFEIGVNEIYLFKLGSESLPFCNFSFHYIPQDFCWGQVSVTTAEAFWKWCAHEVKLLSRVRLFETSWTVAYQDPQSIGFSRQEYWSGLPFPSPGDLPDAGIEPGSPTL